MEPKYRYFNIKTANKNETIMTCVVDDSVVSGKDMSELDVFLNYYGQTYTTSTSIFEEAATHYCASMKEIRGHIIDRNRGV